MKIEKILVDPTQTVVIGTDTPPTLHFKLLRGVVVPLAVRAPPSLYSLTLHSLETKIRARVEVLRREEVGLGGIVDEEHSHQLAVARRILSVWG